MKALLILVSTIVSTDVSTMAQPAASLTLTADRVVSAALAQDNMRESATERYTSYRRCADSAQTEARHVEH